VIPGWSYQTDRVFLTPYDSAWTGTQVIPHVLSAIWLRLREDDLLDTVFPGMGDLGHDAVVSMLSKRTVQLLWKRFKEGPIALIGFSFIDSADGVDGARKAMFGFAFFKEYWGTIERYQATHLMLAYWFSVLKIDVLFGITLRSNRLARNLARKFGCVELADVPRFLYCNGELADATLVMLEKESFAPLFNAWHGATLDSLRKEAANGQRWRN
jgi:hypothetical protein